MVLLMARQERSAGFIIFYRRDPRGADAAGADPATDPAEPLFLLLDYGRHWDFAKGHVHEGESDLDAALRELREETGITDVRVVPDFEHPITYFFRHPKRGLVRKTVVFFLAESAGRDVVLSHEHVGYTFLPFDRAVAKVTFPTAKQVLHAAQEHLSGRAGNPDARREGADASPATTQAPSPEGRS